MSQIYASEHQKQHEFFVTIKKYAERLNQQKNLSLNYLQTINKLSAQLNEKDGLIQRLLKQIQQLKQKLSLYEQVMARSRIIINSGNKNLQNHSTMAVDVNSKNHIFSSPKNNYSSLKFSRLIGKQKITESFMQTRNQLDYLKEYDQQAYEKLSSKINNYNGSLIIQGQKEAKVSDSINLNEKLFPIFEDFIIFKPTQNCNSSPDNLSNLKLIFSLSNKQIKKGNKLYESVSTYLCHNSGTQWTAQQYKPQVTISKVTTGTKSNNSIGNVTELSNTTIKNNVSSQSDEVFVYLSNSEETLQPIVHSSDYQTPISSVYLDFNPSLYYFGFCFKSHCLQYINGKLHKIPLIYAFISRYPFLSYWRQLLQITIQRLNIKNEKDMSIFRDELQSLKEKSTDQLEGIVAVHKKNDTKADFRFNLLQKEFRWKKIMYKSKLKDNLLIRLRQPSQNAKVSNLQYRQRYYSQPLPNESEKQLSQVILGEIVPAFACYNIELIIDVLLLLLLQIPIAIISRSQSLLQKFMLYFVYIINPLKYPFPIIFNLPETMTVVLQSPFPSFLGLTDPSIIQPYMFERTVFDLDQKVAKSWPNIDFYNQSRECVVKWISKSIDNEQNQVSRLDKINQIVKILISPSRNYPQDLKQLRTYRKYFKKTQIWHLFSHSREQNSGK